MAPIINVVQSSRFAPAVAGGGEDDLKALDFDGVNEGLRNTTTQAMGIANAWSIAQWIKLDVSPTLNSRAFQMRRTGNVSMIDVSLGNGGLDNFNVVLRDSGATAFKNYKWVQTTHFSVDTWVHWVLTWDGTNLLGYFDGTEDASPDKSQKDDSGTMDDADRNVSVSNKYQGGGSHVAGRFHSTAVWDVVLTSTQITAVYNSGNQLDLQVDSGSYGQSADLQHYWRHGFNSSDIGEDLGNASVLIDIGNNAENVTSADIVTDSPGA